MGQNKIEDIGPVEERKWYDGFLQWGDSITQVAQKEQATASDWIGAAAKTILGTDTDILTNLVSGVVGWGEDVVDAGASLAGMLTETFGWDSATQSIRDFVTKDLYDEQEITRNLFKSGALTNAFSATNPGLAFAIPTMFTIEEWLNPTKSVDDGFGGIENIKDDNSVLGETSKGILQSTGETLAKQGIQATTGVPVGDIITGVTVYGSQAEQALKEDANFMQAGGSGLISAAAEIMFEKLSGGIKISGHTLDEGLTKLMSRGISNVALRNFLNFAKDITGEALEEAATEFVGKLGTFLYKDRDQWDEILFSKDALVDYIQSAISGGLMGGAFNAGNAVNSTKKGVDYKSGLTNDEQKVVDKVTENAIKQKETDGKKLSAKEKNLLYNDILKQLEDGDISITDIEDALGEEVFKDYADTIRYEDDIMKQYEELGKKKNPTLAEMSMYDELKSKHDDIKENSQREALKKQMSEKVFERVKDSKLMNSYANEARRGETFQADVNEYAEAERATIQSAIDAGFLNNTNKTRRLINWIAKIAAKTGIKVDFTTNEKLKESGFAVDGKFVNGYRTKDGIGLNMQSKKVLETVVGHELTHIFEGTDLYTEMQKILYDYADSKGELKTRRKAIEDLYKGVTEDIDSELTAELVGDYLFTDQEFINRLANDNRNLFQKIWDEIKYMWKQAHPSSPEAQKLEQLKRAFEKAYEESGKKRIINKLTGEEISSKTYEVLERLLKGEQVSSSEIEKLKEVREGFAKISDITRDFFAKHPELKNEQQKNLGTYLLKSDERIALRNEIISKRLTEGSFSRLDENGKEVYNGDVRRNKRIDIVVGLPASGKSSSIVNPLSEYYKSVVIDSDIIKTMLPEFNDGWGASLVHEESSKINMELLEKSMVDGKNIVLPVVGAKASSVETYIGIAKKMGYDVNVHLNELSNAKATGRLLLRYFNDKRFIPPSVVTEKGNKPTEVYEQIKQRGDVDGYTRWNNDVAKGKRPILSESSRGNELFSQYSASWRASRGGVSAGLDESSKQATGTSVQHSLSEQESSTGDASTYERTDDFRRIQAESQGMPYESWNFYLRGGKNESVQRRVANVLRGEMDAWRSSGGSYNGVLTLQGKDSQFNMYEGVEPELFHDVFEVARKYLENGELVDLHEVETTDDHGVGYKYCYNYLSDDGLSGFSITPDGDLISVFNASDKKGFLRAISNIVKSKATTLDCYASPNQNLQGMYERVFGFKTASIMDYNMEFDHDNIAANHKKPPVAFMVNTTSEVKTEHFTEDQYDEAVDYRNSFINKGTQFSLSEDTTEATPRDVYFARVDEMFDKLKGGAANKYIKVDGYGFYINRNPVDESASITIKTPDGQKLNRIINSGNFWTNGKLWREAAKMVADFDYPNVATASSQAEAGGAFSEIEGKDEEVKKTFKEKVAEGVSNAKGIAKNASTLLVDKYQPIENLALKTGNRELDAKANSMRTAERAAQHYIGNGADGVRAINDLRQEVEASGLEGQFEEYMYDLLTVDRMSLEERAKPVIDRLGKKFANLRLDQIKAIAKREITSNTTEKTAQSIRDAQEYLKAISTRNKPVRGDFYTADIARANATMLEQKYPQFKEWANGVYANTNYMLDKMVRDGLITQETAERFRELYPHFVPIRRTNRDGKAIDVPLDTNRTGVDAPIKGATGGDGTIGYLFKTLAMRAEQTYLAGAKNRFGVELKNTLKAKTTNTDVDVDDVFDGVETHEDRLKAGENGASPTFTVFENGKRVTFEIPEDIYEALKPTPDVLKGTSSVLNAITKFQRGVLTEYNPFFMLRNAAKDFQDVIINSQHAKETYKNFPEAAKQLIDYAKGADAKYAKEYFESGAEDLTYFNGKDKLFNSKDVENPWQEQKNSELKKVLGFVPSKISEASNFVERVPRLAEYIASRKSGASIDVAMLDAARVTTNFAAGGDLTKFLNRNGATFLNASVQGAAQAVRNVREAKANGLKGALTLGAKVVAAGLPFVLINALVWGDDDEYEELSDYVKENYYIVAKYGDGQFVRIPKGRMAAVIQNAFEQMGNLITGNDEVDLQRFGELLVENVAPNNPLENNIFAPIKNVIDNKTWYGDDLVPQRLQDLPAGEQSDETTDLISKWLGETLNVSPYKLNYLLDQYSGVFGDMLLPSLTPQAESGGNSLLGGAIGPLTDQFTTDSVMKNQNVSDFYDTLDDLTAAAKSKYATDADTLRYKYMNSINSELSNLYKKKRELQNSNLSNSAKYNAVREIQRQIDELAQQALNSYENVKIGANGASVGGITFEKNKNGEWQKSTSTSQKTISPSQYDKIMYLLDDFNNRFGNN